MAPHDDLQREVDRLTRRQDQLEREVDRQRLLERREMEQQFRDRDRRLRSLEQSRDNGRDLWTYLPLVVALIFLIIVVTAAIASREQRQDPGELEQRSPSSFHAPPPSSGGHLQPGIAVAGAPYLKHHPNPTNHGPTVPGS